MLFKDLAIYLQKLEKTPSRNEMIVILAELFKKVPTNEMEKVIYLLQGRVVPLYVDLEFGMADKYMVKAIAQANEMDEKEARAEFKRIGDIGDLAQKLRKLRGNNAGKMSVNQVFEVLTRVANTNGEGSVEKKLTLIAKLLTELDSLSARFVARIPVGKMRLGFSDMTILDSLSWMVRGDKSARKDIEQVFNIRPDLGYIATTIKKEGIKGLGKAAPTVFTPILMAKAERLSSGEEIIKKIGECAIEPKFDGFRLQVHYDGKNVKLFTRNLENVTFMYPDIVEGIKSEIVVKNVILEGEAIAYDPKTGDYLPFQITTQRKRKYGIEEKAKEVPLKLICFELLMVNGRNLINESYRVRRGELTKIIKKRKTILLSDKSTISDPKKIELFFDDALSKGFEGIVAKRLEGSYQAGARSWNWIKLKRSYSSHLDDTIDCVVMGHYGGRGKRIAFGLGAFLIGIYDKKNDKYVTIAKVGTGLTDEEWKDLYKRCESLKVKEKPPLFLVDKNLEPDVWVEGKIVVEIRADEITRSAVHTAGRVMKVSKSGKAQNVDISGYALRFPRLERFRDDKNVGDITSLKEIEKMFEAQKK